MICEKLVAQGGTYTMYQQNSTGNSGEFTVEELLSMFKTEAQSICKEPEGIPSIAESTLRHFVKCYSNYVRIV